MRSPACPCCSSTDFKPPLATDGGPYLACRNCRSAFQASRFEPTVEFQDKFEDAQERFYGDDSVMLASGFEALQEGATRRRLAVVREYLRSGSLFEVGPGNGKVLALMRANGYDVEAVEHSEVLARAVEQSTGAKVFHGDFNGLDIPKIYDAYMSFHVIEHVFDFVAHLVKAASITRLGGYAFIATPNVCSLEHFVSGSLAPNFSTAHLQLFSKKGLGLALKQAGWQLISAKTPEYPIAWLRVITAFLRKMRGKDNAVARGGYASAASPRLIQAVRAYAIVTWPIRKVQELFGRGEELFVVARKI